MNFEIKKVKIVVTVPDENLNSVREAMCSEGAGVIGEYSYCSNTVLSVGTFLPSNNAKPYIGKSGNLEFVVEKKLEVVCDVTIAKKVIAKLRKVHPYEEPAIDVIPLISEEDLV